MQGGQGEHKSISVCLQLSIIPDDNLRVQHHRIAQANHVPSASAPDSTQEVTVFFQWELCSNSLLTARQETQRKQRASTHFLCLEQKYSINSKSYWQETHYCNLKIAVLCIYASVWATLCLWRLEDNLQDRCSSSITCRQNSGHQAWCPLSHRTGPVITTLHNSYMMHVIFFKVENTTACVNFLQSFQSTLPSNGKMNEINFIVSSKIDNSLTVK